MSFVRSRINLSQPSQPSVSPSYSGTLRIPTRASRKVGSDFSRSCEEPYAFPHLMNLQVQISGSCERPTSVASNFFARSARERYYALYPTSTASPPDVSRKRF
ncbi:hypothetical protein MVEN_00081500 [Mycena venus]|uniref:Uncharacterized protein n=1 Tax=Mycena venus TaxID=2733690 RepID=A0A8H7DI55_9AGAR|nr:hypothetical protein MVEN_00081500 [Mycena venus]